MITNESFSDSVYENETRLAELELSAFVGAVTELFGSDQAKISARDWLDESDLMDSPPLSTTRDWRAVTVAASARLAHRLNGEHQHPTSNASSETKIPSMSSSHSFASKLVV